MVLRRSKIAYDETPRSSQWTCGIILGCLLSCTTSSIENLDSGCSWDNKPGEGPCKVCVCHDSQWICSDPICSWAMPVNQPFCVPGCVEDLIAETDPVENLCEVEITANGQQWQAPECLKDAQGYYVLTQGQYTLPNPLIPACVAYLGDSNNFSPSPLDDRPSSCQQDENLGIFVFVESLFPPKTIILRDCLWSSSPEQFCATPPRDGLDI